MSTYIPIPAVAAGTWREGVAAAANLPASGNAQYDVRAALSEQALYLWTGSAWVSTGGGGGGGGVTTVGSFSGSAQTDGASISSTTITFGPASATLPGMVSTVAQTWAGVKTISSAPVLSALTANKPVFTDSGKALTSTGTVPVANGGTNSTTSLNNNRVMQSSGGSIVEAAAIAAGKMLFSDSNGIPAGDTWSYDSANHVLKMPVNSGNTTNILQIGTNSNTWLGTDDGNDSRVTIRVPTGGRLGWDENTTRYLTAIPASGYLQIGKYDGTNQFNILKSVGKCVDINGIVPADMYDVITPVSSVGSSPTDLISITTNAKILATVKDGMEALCWGTFAANINLKSVVLSIGGVTICTIPSLAYNGTTWKFEVRIVDTGSNTQKYIATAIVGLIVAAQSSGTLTLTDTNTNIMKAVGTGVADSDIVNEEIFIWQRPASPN